MQSFEENQVRTVHIGRLFHAKVSHNDNRKKAYLLVSFSQAAPSLNSCCARTSWEIKNILCHNFPVTQNIPRERTFKISNKGDFKLQRGDLALIKLGISAGSTSHIYLFISMVWCSVKTVWCIEVTAHG